MCIALCKKASYFINEPRGVFTEMTQAHQQASEQTQAEVVWIIRARLRVERASSSLVGHSI